jgi:hypothetical protein
MLKLRELQMYILLVVLGFAEISVTARELHSVHSVSKGACGGYKTSNKAVEMANVATMRIYDCY